MKRDLEKTDTKIYGAPEQAKNLPKELDNDQKKKIAKKKFTLLLEHLAEHPEFKNSMDLTRPEFLKKGSFIYNTINKYINTKGLKRASPTPKDVFCNVFMSEVTNKTSKFNISLEQSLKDGCKTKIRPYFFTCCNSYIGDLNREIYPRRQYTVKKNDLAQIGDIKKSSVENFLKDKILKKDGYLPSEIIGLTYKKKNEKNKIKLENEGLGKNFDDLELNEGTTFNFQINNSDDDLELNEGTTSSSAISSDSEADHIKNTIKKYKKLQKNLLRKMKDVNIMSKPLLKRRRQGGLMITRLRKKILNIVSLYSKK